MYEAALCIVMLCGWYAAFCCGFQAGQNSMVESDYEEMSGAGYYDDAI